MTEIFGTEAWTDVVWAALRSDEQVARCAATWVTGPILIMVDPDGDPACPNPIRLLVDIHEGDVRQLRLLGDAATPLTPLAFEGKFGSWKPVATGSKTLLDAVLAGSIRYRGDLPLLARSGSLATAILTAGRRVDVTFTTADEPAAAGVPA